MSRNELLYLIMTVVSFVGFGAVLAVYSVRQSAMGPEMLPPQTGGEHH
jgi:hypothetical protein